MIFDAPKCLEWEDKVVMKWIIDLMTFGQINQTGADFFISHGRGDGLDVVMYMPLGESY